MNKDIDMFLNVCLHRGRGILSGEILSYNIFGRIPSGEDFVLGNYVRGIMSRGDYVQGDYVLDLHELTAAYSGRAQ